MDVKPPPPPATKSAIPTSTPNPDRRTHTPNLSWFGGSHPLSSPGLGAPTLCSPGLGAPAPKAPKVWGFPPLYKPPWFGSSHP